MKGVSSPDAFAAQRDGGFRFHTQRADTEVRAPVVVVLNPPEHMDWRALIGVGRGDLDAGSLAGARRSLEDTDCCCPPGIPLSALLPCGTAGGVARAAWFFRSSVAEIGPHGIAPRSPT